MKISIGATICMVFMSLQVAALPLECESLKSKRHQTLTLEGLEMKGLDDVHLQVKASGLAPREYGENLDALFDVLINQVTPLVIEFKHVPAAKNSLGTDFDKLWQTLVDATEAGLSEYGVCLESR